MVVCAACGVENPERAKYCLECGTTLAASVQMPAREERKVVTVLFCDLVGFTATSEASDPEDVQRRLDARDVERSVRAEVEVADRVARELLAPLVLNQGARRGAGLRARTARCRRSARAPSRPWGSAPAP